MSFVARLPYIAAGISVCFSSNANASVTVYHAAQDFFAAAPTVHTENFAEYPYLTLFYTPKITIDDVNYHTDQNAAHNGFPGNALWEIDLTTPAPRSHVLETNFIGQDHISFGQHASVQAFGLDLFSYCTYPKTYLFNVTETDGHKTSLSLSTSYTGAYLGLTSPIGIASVEIVNSRNDGQALYNFFFTDISHSAIMEAPIPELSTVVSFAGILASGGLLFRRRR